MLHVFLCYGMVFVVWLTARASARVDKLSQRHLPLETLYNDKIIAGLKASGIRSPGLPELHSHKEWATFFNRDCTRERIEEGYDCLKNTYRIHPQDEHMISFLKEEAALLDTLNKSAACIQRHFRASRKLSK